MSGKGPPVVSLPRRVSPMLAWSAEEPFDSAHHVFEIKWDGSRCLAFVEPNRFCLQNRRFMEMRQRYPELAVLRNLPAGTLVDGEIVVLQGGKPSFERLQQREHVQEPVKIAILSQRLPATLMAFDLLYDHGEKITGQPLMERRRRLVELIRGLQSPHVLHSDTIAEHGIALFTEVVKMGMEGIMAKRIDSPYLVGKRSDHWLKIKVADISILEVIGYVPIAGRHEVGALALARRDQGTLVYVAKVGSGFTEAQRKSLYEQMQQTRDLESRPAGMPEAAVGKAFGKNCRVRHFGLTTGGQPRAPVFVGWA
ncbi:MAG: hypothetical protein IH624_08265 [Phycisphaerae bacterium]|nr:hypothetical protein [Phycisphaerae bacterium]